jgi:hypothetical protein
MARRRQRIEGYDALARVRREGRARAIGKLDMGEDMVAMAVQTTAIAIVMVLHRRLFAPGRNHGRLSRRRERAFVPAGENVEGGDEQADCDKARQKKGAPFRPCSREYHSRL